MKDICFEQGKIEEIGETVSWGNSRYYTHLDLVDKEGQKIRLNAVAAALVVTPKIEIGNEVTIAFLRKNGIMTDTAIGGVDKNRPTRHFKNVIFGVAVSDGYDIERKASSGRVMAMQITMAVFAILTVVALLSPIPALAIVPGIVALVVFGIWSRYRQSNTILQFIENKFEELGYGARMSRVYG
jgi:hypothetical protein